MKRQQFRFKKDLFAINGIYNIPGLIICVGHGYDFKTFCCKNCGEIFATDLESLHHRHLSVETIIIGKTCPNCKSELTTCLVNYPENIFFNGKILINNNNVDKSNFENTELLDVYVLS